MMWYRPQAFVLGGSGKAQLRVRGLCAGYGPFEVIRQLNFDVMPGRYRRGLASSRLEGMQTVNAAHCCHMPG